MNAVFEAAKNLGFDHMGVTDLNAISLEFYKHWISEGLHGDMDYLVRHLEQKSNPRSLMGSAKSAIVVTKSYIPHPYPSGGSLPVAAYARGLDYHHWLKNDLEALVAELKKLFPKGEFLSFVDSSPVLERDFAYRAGLGWIGKNTCLINEKTGSFSFIGGILTDIQLQPNVTLAPDRCGTCTRCMDACPTDAFVAPRKLDATKCISYLTIESDLPIDQKYLPKIDSYFGCDICQTVCPWNRKVIQIGQLADDIVSELKFILSASNRAIRKHFTGTPLTRASAYRHRRNAIIIAANKGLYELQSEIQKWASTYPDICAWALERLIEVRSERLDPPNS